MEAKKISNNGIRKVSAFSVLFVLFLVAAFALAVALFVSAGANYATSAGDESSARVAAFNVMYEIDGSGIGNGATLNEDATEIRIPITAYNYDETGRVSEVDIAYDMIIAFESGWPDGLDISIDDEPGSEFQMDAQENAYTFYDVMFLKGGQQGEMRRLRTLRLSDPDAIDADIRQGLTIDMRARQVDQTPDNWLESENDNAENTNSGGKTA